MFQSCSNRIYGIKMEPIAGIEPATDGLRNRCSTTELHWRPAGEKSISRNKKVKIHRDVLDRVAHCATKILYSSRSNLQSMRVLTESESRIQTALTDAARLSSDFQKR